MKLNKEKNISTVILQGFFALALSSCGVILGTDAVTPSIDLTLSSSTSTISVGESINIAVSGGTLPYTFSILEGSGSISSEGSFTPDLAGVATVKVTDADNQSGELEFNVLIGLSASSITLAKGLTVSDPVDLSAAPGSGFGHTTSVLKDGRVLLVGHSGSRVDIFNPASNSGRGGWSLAPPLATARYEHSASILKDGRVLVVGGGGYLSSVEIFDPAANDGAGTWTAAPPLTTARSEHSASVLSDGRVLVVGGRNSGPTHLSSVEIFDPAANDGAGEWTSGPSLATGRRYHTSSTLKDGRVLAIGGADDSWTHLSSVEIFNPTANDGAGEWSPGPSIPTGRVLHTASVLNDGRVLVAGGSGAAIGYSVEIFDPAANSGSGEWSAGPSLADSRSFHTASVLNDGRVLVAGGYGIIEPMLSSAEIFNPTADGGAGEWISAPSLATGRAMHTASSLNDGKVLVMGGEDSNSFHISSVEIFDPMANGGAGTWSFPRPRFSHAATVLNDGRLIVVGGADANEIPMSSVPIFNPIADGGVGNWSAGPSLTTARHSHTANVLNDGKVLAVGGLNSSSNPLSSAEIFEPTANDGAGAWSAVPPLATARYEHSASVLNDGRVLVVGGRAPPHYFSYAGLSSVEIFNPAANDGAGEWAAAPPLVTARVGHTASVLNDGRVLVVGGWDDNDAPFSSVEIFNPSANGGIGEWTSAPPMATGRRNHSASVLNDGRVLVVGGSETSWASTSSVEIFNPSANGGAGAWTSAIALATARFAHTANVLADGRVLIVGGNTAYMNYTSGVEIFDPSVNGGAGEWSTAPSLVTARTMHTANLLEDGRVLVHGGYNGNPRSETAIFSPFENSTITALGGSGNLSFRLLNQNSGKLNYSAGDTRVSFVPSISGPVQIDVLDESGNSSKTIKINVE